MKGLLLRKVECYRESLTLGMDFLAGAVINDPGDPDDRSILHMYHVELGGWNRPYMELAGQVVREAFLPYADLTGDQKWADLARTVIVDGVLSHVTCTDSNSPAYGLLVCCADQLCDYGTTLSSEELVRYRLNRNEYLDKHSPPMPEGRRWYTFDSAEVLLAAILLSARCGEDILERLVNRLSQRLYCLVEEDGCTPEYYDEASGRWYGKPSVITDSRLLWAYGLMRQAGMSQPDDGIADRLASCLLAHQRRNGIITTGGAEDHVVAEFIIYCIEGLYWGGVLLERPEWVEAARHSFDAILRAPHVLAKTPYFCYYDDWRPVPAATEGGCAGITQEMHHLSVTGQVARLAWLFWKETGIEYYLDAYRRGVDLMFCIQDRRSTGPARGGMPRAVNMPWWRSICPVYTYASALIPWLKELTR